MVDAVLGNHDYRGDAEAQLSPVLREIDSRWLCLRSFIVDSELVEIFFVDTTPFVEEYFTEPQEHKYDWRGIGPQKPYITNLLKDLELALRESTAKWKIVVGHHAIRSVGHHGDTQELINQLLPILQANNIDFYMNGHDHCLEHISDTESPIQFLTSGAGSKAWRGDIKGMNRRDVNFFYDGQGFMSVKLTQTDATIEFYDVFGNVLHRLTSSKQLHSSILCFVSVSARSGLLQRLEHPVKADGSLSLVVIGDRGRKGTYNQSQVATQFLTSGGGSKAWKGDMDKDKTDGIKFYYDGQGFMSAELEETNVKVVYYDILGKVLHVVNLPKGLGTSVSAI
ncbi:Purple acid phosphatase 17 [Glycine max]|nr:Purple acid phosphatase 17 [Glycine max]